MKSETQLRQEFELLNQLSSGQQYYDYFELLTKYPSALNENNYNRNRYRDVLPEEKSRVKLRLFCEDDSDYINASHISGVKQKYISCQAPLPHTIQHFWCMIWEQNTSVVTMLTRTIEGERKKADVYWPDGEGETVVYGRLSTTLKSVEKLAFITIRTIELMRLDTKEKRQVVHLHYTEWPDFGVPETTHKIRELIQLVYYYTEQGISRGQSGPLVAHCSAGIGRVGTFLAILICLEKLMEGTSLDDLNLMQVVLEMRKSRCGMVQTESQYIFIYKVLDDLVKAKQVKVAPVPKKHNLSWRYTSYGLPSSSSSSSDSSEDDDYEDIDEEEEDDLRSSTMYIYNNDIHNRAEISCQQ